jgi:hypothetical protein
MVCVTVDALPWTAFESSMRRLASRRGQWGRDCRWLGGFRALICRMVRYLGFYHHKDPVSKSFQIYLAQSFDLLHWEYLRRLVTNADMPAVALDPASQQVLLVHEQWMNANSGWPSRLGLRIYRSVAHLLAGEVDATFLVPNTLSNLEGTPSIYAWQPRQGRLELGFHFFNQTALRDEVARGVVENFPGQQPRWTAWQCEAYNHQLTATMGVTGNIGGREQLVFQGQTVVLQEGNAQPPPGVPTQWEQWRVWLFSNHTQHFTPLRVETHNNSRALANPWAAVLPGPHGHLVMLVSYYIFAAGAAPRESGPLLFYTNLPQPSP